MNLKLSADVNGFRTAMRNAQQAVKSLDAELKLNAAQMKAGGNEEQLMAERAELLRRQIAEQEKAIEAAGKALEALAKDGKENTTQFNQLRDAMTRNKTKLVEMQTDLKNIGNASHKAADDVKNLGDTLESINKMYPLTVYARVLTVWQNRQNPYSSPLPIWVRLYGILRLKPQTAPMTS